VTEKGDVTITHAESDVFDVWGKKVRLKKPLRFAMLKIDGQTVMSETPQEVGAMKKDASKAKGRALVAGLGLGVILNYMRRKCSVIDVVEPNQQVIDAYREYRGGKIQYDNLYKTTIEDFLLAPPRPPRYDFVYLDTWYGLDSEYLPHINWMTEKAKPFLRKGGRVASWGYDWMVKHHVEDCLELIGKRQMLLEADHRNIERLKLAMPLIGAFADWYRQNNGVSMKGCKMKALDLAMTVEQCPVPLNSFKEWCLIRENEREVKAFTEAIDSRDLKKVARFMNLRNLVQA
jgi:hypothetical protein